MPTYDLQTSERTTAEHVAEFLYNFYSGGIGVGLERRKTGIRWGGINHGSGEYLFFDGESTDPSRVLLFTVKAKGRPREWGNLPTQDFQITPLQVDHKELEKAVQQVRTALGGG